jgi:hypothetical protein
MDESSGKINNQVADCRLDNDGEGLEARTGLLHAVTCMYVRMYVYIYVYTMYYREQNPEVLHRQPRASWIKRNLTYRIMSADAKFQPWLEQLLFTLTVVVTSLSFLRTLP